MNIGVVIGSDAGHYNRREIACELARRWTKKRGGEVYPGELRNRGGGIQFCKFALVQEMLLAHDYVMWLDSDCCVVDDDYDLEAALAKWGHPATKLWHAVDWNGICGCMFVVKSCEWSRRFLDACDFVGAAKDSFGQFEQGTLKVFKDTFPNLAFYMSSLSTLVVADQTIIPQPRPFVWHCSMSSDTVHYMRDIQKAVVEGRFDNYAKAWPGMKHAVRYE